MRCRLIEDNLLRPEAMSELIIRLNSVVEFIQSVKRDSEKEKKENDIFNYAVKKKGIYGNE